MNRLIDRIAEVCHEANRALQGQNGEQVSPPWSASPMWVQESARDGVSKALDGQSPKELHESWCDFKIRNGWVFGEVKDEIEKTHPCLVPYSELPPEQRVKDAVFAAIVRAMAGESRE